MALKRYLAFAGWIYYPDEGIKDLVGDFDSIEEATDAIKIKLKPDLEVGVWGHIWDSETRSTVWEKTIKPGENTTQISCS